MRPFLSIVAGALAASTVVSPAGAQATETSQRFRDPAHITGDPTGLGLDPAGFLGLRYPNGERAAEHTAVPVVAFVVDGRGRIELPTASFLNDVEPGFRHAVCDMLPRLRFHPLVIDGQPMRVLLVQYYGFNTLVTPDEAGLRRAEELMQQRQEAYGTQPVENVIPELERRPHCDDR